MAKEKKSIKKLNTVQYGSVVFGLGLLIAFVTSFITLGPSSIKVVLSTLILFGIVIGFLNIKNSESVTFLVSSVALVLLAGPFLGLVGQNLVQTDILAKLFTSIIALIVPAAIIVALKEIFLTAKDE